MGACPSATTSPPTSATSTRATSWRWSGSASTARAARSTGASCRTSPTRPPTCCATTGVERGDRVAVVLPPTPETAAIFFGTWKNAAHPAVDVGPLRRRRHPHRLRDSQPRVLVTDEANAGRFDPSLVDEILILDDGLLDGASTDFETADTAADDPAQLYYTSGTTGPGQGHRPRPPLPARPRGVRLLPRGPGRRALPRHGRVGVGGRHRAAARAVAPRRRPVVLQRKGGFDPAPAARLPLPPRGHERLHDADGDALDDGDRGRRHAATRRGSAASARPASRSTPRRSAGSASSTGSRCSTTTG